jgi:hypothetical protein
VGTRRRLIALGIVAAVPLAFAGCKRKEEAPAPAPSARPSADHLVRGEIPEGRERAFTLPLPLDSTIKARFNGSVHVASWHTQEELANFVKARVKDGKSTSGASGTRFDQVVVTKDPSKTLTIEVRSAPIAGEYRSQIVVSDVTPLVEEPGTTDADRWKKAGMTPDGKLLDRKHMQ